MTYEEAYQIIDKQTHTTPRRVELNILLRIALKKQMAKKPFKRLYAHTTIIHNYECPDCGAIVMKDFKCCAECGQRLDWGNKK